MSTLARLVRQSSSSNHQKHQQKEEPIVVHIAGTNGKGSVALKIAHALQQQQRNNNNNNNKNIVGLFTSPHVSSFRERIQINGQLISEEDVTMELPILYEWCRTHDIPATFFELVTALAMRIYWKHDCDVVVLETGLGGRLDATNAVTHQPALTIVTSIGLEHERILGDTVELIAAEKGGIFKRNCPVLVGPHVPHAVLQQCAKDVGAGPYQTSEQVLGIKQTTASVEDTADDDDDDDYDIENSRIAQAALQLLQKSHPHLFSTDTDTNWTALTSVRPPCRFERIVQPNGLEVILDVAHNPPAMQYLMRKLQKELLSTGSKTVIRLVVGMSADKDLGQCGDAIRKVVDNDRVHLVQAAHPRAATLSAILQANPEWKDHQARYNTEDPSVTVQVQHAMQLATESSENEVLVVCGSVFLMSETREALGIDEPRDSSYIAEMAGAGVRAGQENFGNSSWPPPPPPPTTTT